MTATYFLPSERFAVAPMVDVTDTVFRQMARIMSRRCMLYTEMIAAEALMHDRPHLLDLDLEVESPVCLQLGGSEPEKLAKATTLGIERGYNAINLNAGCPSDKVQSGCFGAVLMKTPRLIGECFAAMQEAADKCTASGKPAVPVSVKTRIGVDELDSHDFTFELMSAIYEAGCRHLIIHARKAWLKGLSPKENRTVPPLNYGIVYEVKKHFPDLFVTINGGILTFDDCREHLKHVDGVMLGRAIIDNPYMLAAVDQELFGEERAVPSRDELIAPMMELAAKLQAQGTAVHFVYRHLLGLFGGIAGSRLYRRYLSENMTKKGAGPEVLQQAYEAMIAARGGADTATTTTANTNTTTTTTDANNAEEAKV